MQLTQQLLLVNNHNSESNCERGGNSPLFLFIYLATVSILLNSCSTSNGNIPSDSFPLFNGFGFRLHRGEAISLLDSAVVNEYAKRWKGQPMQVPLYKHINHERYELFLGLPFNTSIRQAWLTKSVLNQTKIQVLESDSSTFVYSVQHQDSASTYELFIEKEGNLFYILALGNNKETLDSTFSYKSLSSRLEKYN